MDWWVFVIQTFALIPALIVFLAYCIEGDEIADWPFPWLRRRPRIVAVGTIALCWALTIPLCVGYAVYWLCQTPEETKR